MKYTKQYKSLIASIKRYYTAIAKCEEDAKVILKKGAVELSNFDFGKQSYFFIGRGMTLYCKKAELNANGLVCVYAGPDPDADKAPYVLDWQDMSQDAITLVDFMTAIYNEEDNPN